jgi:hypothetical protein
MKIYIKSKNKRTKRAKRKTNLFPSMETLKHVGKTALPFKVEKIRPRPSLLAF